MLCNITEHMQLYLVDNKKNEYSQLVKLNDIHIMLDLSKNKAVVTLRNVKCNLFNRVESRKDIPIFNLTITNDATSDLDGSITNLGHYSLKLRFINGKITQRFNCLQYETNDLRMFQCNANRPLRQPINRIPDDSIYLIPEFVLFTDSMLQQQVYIKWNKTSDQPFTMFRTIKTSTKYLQTEIIATLTSYYEPLAIIKDAIFVDETNKYITIK